jgi:hypothetical protein
MGNSVGVEQHTPALGAFCSSNHHNKFILSWPSKPNGSGSTATGDIAGGLYAWAFNPDAEDRLFVTSQPIKLTCSQATNIALDSSSCVILVNIYNPPSSKRRNTNDKDASNGSYSPLASPSSPSSLSSPYSRSDSGGDLSPQVSSPSISLPSPTTTSAALTQQGSALSMAHPSSAPSLAAPSASYMSKGGLSLKLGGAAAASKTPFSLALPLNLAASSSTAATTTTTIVPPTAALANDASGKIAHLLRSISENFTESSLSEPLQGCSVGSTRSRKVGKLWLFDVYLWRGKQASNVIHATALSKAFELFTELSQARNQKPLQSLINTAQLVPLSEIYQREPLNRTVDALILSQNHLASRVLYHSHSQEQLQMIVSAQTVDIWQRENTLCLLDKTTNLSRLRRNSLKPLSSAKSMSYPLRVR